MHTSLAFYTGGLVVSQTCDVADQGRALIRASQLSRCVVGWKKSLIPPPHKLQLYCLPLHMSLFHLVAYALLLSTDVVDSQLAALVCCCCLYHTMLVLVVCLWYFAPYLLFSPQGRRVPPNSETLVS